MKYIIAFLAAFFIATGVAVSAPNQSTSNLEREIELIFVYQPHSDAGEKYDKVAKIRGLGREEEVKAIVLNMIAKYDYSRPGTIEAIYLSGATWILGELGLKEASRPLAQMVFDHKIHENVRALAVRSLGQIDAEANKEILLKALAKVSDYFQIRVYAAEALAKTKDPNVLKALERYTRQERDDHVRQQFQKAAQALRARVSQEKE